MTTTVINDPKPMGKLVIVRHHESEWNKEGRWTGLHDSPLTPYGAEKSKEMGELLKDMCFDYAFASMKIRTIQTLSHILHTCNADDRLPTEYVAALNERDYGDYTGKNKWEMKELLGEEEFNKLRRSWDYPIPHGESLKMVYERALPFFLDRILPLLREGKNVILACHGNTIRALMKYIENIPEDKIATIEAPFGGIMIYDLDNDGHLVHKEIRMVQSEVNA